MQDFDRKLWFVTSCGENKAALHYVIGNAHTFPGRMLAYCPERDSTFCVALSDLADCSEELKYWAQGFLHGNTPEYPVLSEEDEDDQEKVKLYEEAEESHHKQALEFIKTGYWKLND